jgi:hypothetical protein
MVDMTLKEASEIKKRICDGTACGECPLYTDNNIHTEECESLIIHYPNDAIPILAKWNAEHPVKTYLTDFFEKYPNAKKRDNGLPMMAVCDLGVMKCEGSKCKGAEKCWNQPLEEVER